MDIREQLQSTLGAAYTLEYEMGGGGMSRVFVATETALGRKVVIKLLAPELTGALDVDRFQREIRVAAKLQHPHIVPVLAAGDANGLPYYTMPFVEGESLRVRLASGPLPIHELVHILRDVAIALGYAHERGIVHRDIKPDNVLLSGGSATVTDFGIAKALAASRDGHVTNAHLSALTALGTSLGTPAYMAPEQAAADPTTDHRADIYSFGCLAYELLVGRPPFVESSPQRLLAAQMTAVPESVLALRPDTPPALADLVMRCLEKSANDRPQSAYELTQALDAVATPHGGVPTGGPTFSRALIIYAGAFIAVAIIAKFAIGWIGLPNWVFPGSLIVMGLGLPVILFTGYVNRVTHHESTTARTLTPSPSATTRSSMATLAIKAGPHFSWRRTALGGVSAFGAFALLIAVFMLLRAFGIGPVGSLLASGKLNASEKLVIADFSVTNADTALGAVVSDAVRTGLAESSVITLVSPAAVASTLRQMQRAPTTRLDALLAREVAQREGVKAVVDGSLTGVSGGYIVSLRLVTSDSATVLASFRETGDGPRGLIDAADKLARELRGKVGESLRAVNGTPALAEATTGSLDALRTYSAAVRANNVEGNFQKAVELSRQAVATDSTFGSAYRILAIALGNTRAPSSAIDSAVSNAFRYRDHMPEVERLAIVAAYYMTGPHRERGKRIAAYEALLLKDPRSFGNNIGTAYGSRRDYARAESVFASDIRKDSSLGLSYTNLAESQLSQGKYQQANATLTLVRARFPTNLAGYTRTAYALYDEGHVAEFGQYTDSLYKHGPPAMRVAAAGLLGAYAVLHGRVTEAEGYRREVGRMAAARDAPRASLGDTLSVLEGELWARGPSDMIVHAIDAAIAAMPFNKVAPSDRPYASAARVYALAGRPDKARAVLDEGRRALAGDTALIRLQALAVLRSEGEIALDEHKPLVALDRFRRTDVQEDGYPNGECAPCPRFNFGRAFDLAEMPDSAIAEYESYLALPYYQRLGPDAQWLARTHKRLGELYEAKGNRQKAAAHYSEFIELWKNADPEFQPAVAEARKRLARLSSDR